MFSSSSGLRRTLLVLVVLAGLMACECAAAATVGGSVVATTNYVYRGLTQSDHSAALQADVHVQGGRGWFAGLWGSVDTQSRPLDFGPEVNLYLGRAWTFTPEWSASLHLARYLYPQNDSYYDYDYNEAQASLSFQDRLTMSVALSSDIFRYSYRSHAFGRGRQLSYEASFRQPLWRTLSLTAGLGRYDLDDLFGESYWAWSGGFMFGLHRLQLSLARFGVDRPARQIFAGQTADGRWALTAAWRF